MSKQAETSFDNRCEILREFFWHRLDNPEYVRFIVDNFDGVVLGSSYAKKLAEPTPAGIELINTTFINLIFELWNSTTDEGYETYDDLTGDYDY